MGTPDATGLFKASNVTDKIFLSVKTMSYFAPPHKYLVLNTMQDCVAQCKT
jgi:hypothetical protein